MSTRNFLAATFIGKHADAAQQAEILDMLGIADEFGMCAQDDDRVWAVGIAGPVGGRSESKLTQKPDDRPALSTAPESLRVLPTVREVNQKRVVRTQELAECGTESARRRHRRKKEKCEACARPPRVKTEKPAQPSRRRVAVCGTDGGYKKHRREGTTKCEPCKEAHRETERRRTGATPRPQGGCGTVSGHGQHKRNGEKPCSACYEAANARARELRANRRALNPPMHLPSGDGHHNAKVTEKQIANMQWMRDRGWTNRAMSREFGVHEDTISRLLTGRGRVLLDEAG